MKLCKAAITLPIVALHNFGIERKTPQFLAAGAPIDRSVNDNSVRARVKGGWQGDSLSALDSFGMPLEMV